MNNQNNYNGIAPENVIYCPVCGAKMDKNSRNCIKCGAINYKNPNNNSMKQYDNTKVNNGKFINTVNFSAHNNLENFKSLANFNITDEMVSNSTKSSSEKKYMIKKIIIKLIIFTVIGVCIYLFYPYIKILFSKLLELIKKYA